MKIKKTLLLMILDGFGIRKDKYFNGVLNANMKNYFEIWNTFPHTHLQASGPLVGLPHGQIGSSEVGHMTIGAGKLIKQPIVRISEDIYDGNFFKNKKLNQGLNFISKTGGNIHIMGLLGTGGVHSIDSHLYAFLHFYDTNADKIKGKIFIHNFLDGRDTPQQSALEYLEELEEFLNKLKNKDKFVISTICGRYYAMDRDLRWNRTEKAYNMLVYENTQKFKNGQTVINTSYKNKIYDEFVNPSIIQIKPIKDGDLCVFYNFRSDRPKQLVKAFTEKNFDKFETKKFKNLKFQTLTEYSPDFNVDVLYPTIFPTNTLGEIISKNKLKQLRIAESEKFPHVTYFLSGLRYEKFKREEQIKINSPKVATYDLQPEMSSDEVTKTLIKELDKNVYDFIVLNYANSDMVGHTGNYDAVKKAMKHIDEHIKTIKNKIEELDGTLIITADHGNCETMKDENGKPHTKHTYNLVPFVLCNKNYKLKQNYNDLSLYNIAPTILELLNIEKEKEMEESLIER